MPRNEFPQFTVRQGVIIGVYPGATSEEVESQLTTAVENYVFGFTEVKKAKTYSQSKEGMMYVFVELNDNVKNADQFWSKLKHGLTELKATLPSGVLALIANSDFGDTSALLITLSSDTKSYKELEYELKKLEAECRKIPATSKIKHFGLQKEKIFVNVRPELLNETNIKSVSLFGKYSMNGMVNYAGELKDGEYNLSVHLPSNFESEKDLADQIVYSDPNGNIVRLKDIATIERRYESPDNYIKQNGKKTILLSLEMQPGNNIVEYGEQVEKAIEKFKMNVAKDISVSKISELPKYVEESVSDFMREFLIAIVAVILVTLILLPFRVASVAGITVPIAVLVTLAFLYFFGIELHTVSLAALILVLGMIVDNSIVIIDNHIEKMDHNISPWKAAIESAGELVVPVITATLAIMAAYIPLGFMVPGTAGEFMKSLPSVVSIALIVSVFVAVLLVPYLNYVFIKKGLGASKNEQKRRSVLDVLQDFFNKSLEKAFNYPKSVIAFGVSILALTVILFYNLDQQMFPEMERNQFAVEVSLPTGYSLEKTAEVVDSLEQLLLRDGRITNVTSFIGTSSPRFHTVYAPNMPSPNYGQLLVNTISKEATREIIRDYETKYSDAFPNAHVKWKILIMQASPAPIEIRISDDSINNIREAEKQILTILGNTKHVGWVRDNWEQKRQGVKVNLDRDKANRMGYSKSLVATSLMIGLNGLPLTTVWEDDYPVEVHLSQENTGIKDINTLGNQYINSTSSFTALPLRSIATFTPEWTEGNIVRRNGTRTLTILVDNAPDGIASAILNQIKPQIAALNLPDHTSITYGGDEEAQNETFIPMGYALGLSILLIFLIILFQFKKIRLSLIVMSTMVLSLPGVAIGLTVMGYPFSTTAFIGIISLCGMAVRNGIILIDYARELKEKQNMLTREAALAAGKRRMRPIFLTSAAASAGVIPMIASRSPLWGPVGTVICFGLMIAMILTLYILPIIYTLTYCDQKDSTKRFLRIPSSKAVTVLIILLSLIPRHAQSQKLSLDSCKQLALEQNRKILDARYNVMSASEIRKDAYTNYFPNVSASLFAMRSPDYLIKGEIPEMNLPVYDGNPENLPNATQFTYFPKTPINAVDYLNMASASLTLPIYAGGQIRTGNKLAKIGEEASQVQMTMVTTDVLVHTEELYWTIIALNEKLKSLDSYDALLDTLIRDVTNFYTAGLAQRNDLLKVQLKKNELQMNRLKLINGIMLARKSLCQHIGIEHDSALDFCETPVLHASLSPQVSTRDAVFMRDEYNLLNKAVEAEELQLKMIRGKLMPQIALGGILAFADVQNSESTIKLAFASLSIPISDWWAGSHKIKTRQFKLEQARNKQIETSELLALQIEQGSNELKQSLDQIKLAETAVEQADENARITEDNYHAGIVNISDLLEAKTMIQSCNDNLTNSKCNYKIAKAKYLQAIGRFER